MSKTPTQQMKVLEVMFQLDKRTGAGKFYYGYELQQGDGIWVGYKAPTRLSELCKAYPILLESYKDGKFVRGRIRYANSAEFLEKLPAELRGWLTYLLKKYDIRYQKWMMVMEPGSEPNTVKPVRKLIET